ncbi:MAG: PAS domain-containing sensor histidine kinase, partial [Candidatus Hydrothermarchaeaceae archaeon]
TRAVREGAQDYLVKGQMDNNLLARAIRYAIERKKAEEALKESEEKYSTLVEKGNDGIIIIQDGLLRFVNSKMVEIAVFSLKDVIGKPLIDFISPEYRELVVDRYKKRMSGEEVPSQYEAEILSKDGRKIPVEINASVIEYEGRPADMAIIRDITERKQVEEELRRYATELEEANRLKRLFIDVMTHDLLGPAGAMMNAAELLLDEAEGAERELSEVIEESAKKQMEIIELAGTLSKLKSVGEMEKESLDLKEAVDKAVEDTEHLFKAAGMRVENNVTESIPVNANSVIGNVFSNLLSNAARYAADGKKVVIDALEEDESHTVMIKDYGPGVPDKYKEDIFERFTRKAKVGVKGSGLGLAIIKSIMDIHDGKVWVEDNPEGGAVFKVSLPK